MLDAEIKVANLAAVIQVAKNLGITPADLRNAPGATAEKLTKQGPPLSAGPAPPPRAGTKCTASRSMAPPPRRQMPAPAPPMDIVPEDASPAFNTCSRSRTPNGLWTQAALEIVQPTPRPVAQTVANRTPPEQAPSPYTSRVASSMHNPRNKMAVNVEAPPNAPPQEQTERAPPPPPQTHGDPNAGALTSIQNMLMTLAARIEQVASLVEGLMTTRPQPLAGPPTGAPQGNQPPKVNIPRQQNLDNGFIQTEPTCRAWNNVTAQGIAQQSESNTMAARAAAAQGRTQSGQPSTKPSAARNTPSNMEVTVLQDSSLATQEAETAVRVQQPDNIVCEVQKQINAQVKNNPIQILAGRWSSSVRQTGNFIFTIRGRVNFPLITSYLHFLLAPFPGSELALTGNWTWAQLRGVPIWNEDDIVHSQELLTGLRTNPAFENTILTTSPRWQVLIERLSGDTV
ncbi:hypothetical protein V8E53_009969 [Lactarius tabidus]